MSAMHNKTKMFNNIIYLVFSQDANSNMCHQKVKSMTYMGNKFWKFYEEMISAHISCRCLW